MQVTVAAHVRIHPESYFQLVKLLIKNIAKQKKQKTDFVYLKGQSSIGSSVKLLPYRDRYEFQDMHPTENRQKALN